MTPTNEHLDVQRKIEEWIADIHVDHLSPLIISNCGPLADSTLHSSDDFIDGFLDRFAFDEENIARLHELYYYQSEERDQQRMLAESVDAAPSPYDDVRSRSEHKQAKRALAGMFTMRHDEGMFPCIKKYGTDVTPDEQRALQCITDIHTAVDTVYEALEYDKHVQLDALFRTFCFKMYEVCAASMAEFAHSETGRELRIAVKPIEWFERFLAGYRTALERLANELSREPGQEINSQPSAELGREKKWKPLLH